MLSNLITHQCHLPDNELCVVERSNLLKALAIDNGHGLKAHGLHVGLGREQEAVVEIIKELGAENIAIRSMHMNVSE